MSRISHPLPAGGYYGQAVAPAAFANEQQVAALAQAPPQVLVNPNYYNTDRGRAELAQRQRDAGSTQLQELRDALDRQSQTVQEGSHVYSPEERAMRQSAISAGQSALDITAPFVHAGLLDTEGATHAANQALGDEFNRQRNVRAAAADWDAIEKASRGGYTQQQVESAVADFKRVHGVTANYVPGYQTYLGTREDVLKSQESTLQAFAAGRGLDRRFVKWDEKNGRPEYDTAEFAVADKQAEQQAHRVKLAGANADAIAEQAKGITEMIQAQERAASPIDSKTGKPNLALGAGKAQPYLYSQLQILQNAQQDAILDMRKELNNARQPAVRYEHKQMTTALPDQNAPAAIHAAVIERTPAPSQNVAYPAFNSQSDVSTALQTGKLRRGEAFIFNGKKVAIVGNQVIPQ